MGKGRPRTRLHPVSGGSVQPTDASDVGAGEGEVPTLGVERQGRSSQETRRRKRKRGVRDKEVSPNLKNLVQISKSFL